jgi:HSP20 family molecular chaperone IbpA
MIRYTKKLNETNLKLSFELPGKAKEDVKLTFTQDYGGDYLNIFVDGKKHEALISNPWQRWDFNFDKTKATMKNGLLDVEIPFDQEKENSITIE